MSYPLRIDMPCGPEVMAGALSPSQMETIRRNSELTRLEQEVVKAAIAYTDASTRLGGGPNFDQALWRDSIARQAAMFAAVDRLKDAKGE